MKEPVMHFFGTNSSKWFGTRAAWRLVTVLSVISILVLANWPVESWSQRKKCVDCHEDFKDKTKLKFVHEPFTDCETCHKRHGFSQKLVLVKGMPDLCVECHDNVAAEMEVGTVHAALSDGRCTVCHEPHASDLAGLLRESDSDLPVCVKCHTSLAGVMAEKETHEPFAKADCAVCHQPHSSEFPSLLVASEEAVCASCHENSLEKHKFAGVSDFECRDCHDPHLVSKKSKTAAYSHDPFASGDCEDCHSVEDGEIALEDDFPPADLCETCHDDITDLVSGTTSHFGADALTAGGTSTCMQCHEYHTSRIAPLLVETEMDLCSNCHEGLKKPGMHQGLFHEPYAIGQCSACHEPHGGGTGASLNEEISTLCISCHQTVATRMKEGPVSHEALESVECTECHAPHVAPNMALLKTRFEETCYSCHDQQPFATKHEPYANANCGACHRNHANTPALLAAEINVLCHQCHGPQIKLLRAPIQHPPAQDESCDFCHQPHGSDFDGLLTQNQTDLCFECHDMDELTLASAGSDEAIQLHKPVADGDCGSCHNPHGSELEGLLNREGQALCYGCHTAEKVSFAEGTVHKPVEEGDCTACHTVHGGPRNNLIIAEEPDLCVTCHDFTVPPLDASHKGFDVAESKCTTCHNPHNSSGDNLLNAITHEPFADGDCESCHEEATSMVASFDADMCYMCHDDKEEGVGHQHAGDVKCIDCHTPHTSRFESLLSNPSRLCKECHQAVFEAKVGEGGQLTLHKPMADGLCLDCHKMHGSEHARFLVASQQELCADCHDSIKERAEHLTKHDPFSKGKCSACHETHAAGEVHMLKKDTARLCKSCHKLSTAEMATAHGNIALSGENCATCHDPHSTAKASSALVFANLHSPYEDGDCEACHSEDGSVRGEMAVCFECHDEDEFTSLHIAGRKGEQTTQNAVCLDCHSPHAGHENILRRKSEMETCLQCHDRKQFSKKIVHAALDDGCTACHDLHNNNYKELQGAAGNDLCTTCHDDAKTHAHPVGSEYNDPRTGNTLTCASCHEPHSSDHEFMLTFDKNRDLCVQCHTSGTMRAH